MANKVFYVSYFRYDGAETQHINGVYNSKNFKKKWLEDKKDFFSYGPDDVSATYLLKLPEKLYNTHKELIEKIQSSVLDGSDCEDLLEKMTPDCVIDEVWGGFVCEDADGNIIEVGNNVQSVNDEDNTYEVVSINYESENMTIRDASGEELVVNPEDYLVCEDMNE